MEEEQLINQPTAAPIRNVSISIAKALAIIFVVITHSGAQPYISKYLAMFMLPLFFFMSGYCFKEKYLTDGLSFIKKRVTGIYWPFVRWEFIFLLFTILSTPVNLKRSLFEICCEMRNLSPLLGGLWFLKSLFWGSLLFYVVRRFLPANNYLRLTLLLLIAIVTCYFKPNIPLFNIESSEVIAAFFIMAGYVYRSEGLQIEQNKWFCILASILVGIGSFFCYTSIRHTPYYLIIPNFFFAIIGTIMTFGLSKYIQQKYYSISSVLDYVGNHTMEVLVWHFTSFRVVNIFVILIMGYEYHRIFEFPVIGEFAFPGGWIVYAFVGVGLPTLCCKLVDIVQVKINKQK